MGVGLRHNSGCSYSRKPTTEEMVESIDPMNCYNSDTCTACYTTLECRSKFM